MLNVDALSFDLTDCKPLPAENRLERCWVGPPHVINHLRFRQDDKPYWHFDLTNLQAATRHFAQQCKDKGGAMLSLRFKQSGPLEILHGLFKYRSPFENKRAMYYVGIIPIGCRIIEAGCMAVR